MTDEKIDGLLGRIRQLARPGGYPCLRSTATLHLFLERLATGGVGALEGFQLQDREIEAEYWDLRVRHAGPKCGDLEPGGGCCAEVA